MKDICDYKDNRPCLKVIEEPQSRGYRFRYKCEGQAHGGILAQTSVKNRKIYPTIQICNYNGPARIMAYLVSEDRPVIHAHELTAPRHCRNGVYMMEVKGGDMKLTFPNFGITHTTKRSLVAALEERMIELLKCKKIIQYAQLSDNVQLSVPDITLIKEQASRLTSSITVSAVRICFTAYLPDGKGYFTHRLDPVLSQPIFDNKSPSSTTLRIVRMDKSHSSCLGGEEVFLLCERVQKEDIMVVFSEYGANDALVWEGYGKFGVTDVHRQFAIVFLTPPYRDVEIDKPVQVSIQLKRRPDGQVSEPKIFTYHANKTGMFDSKQKPPSTVSYMSDSMSHNDSPHFISPSNGEYQVLPAATIAMPTWNKSGSQVHHQSPIVHNNKPVLCDEKYTISNRISKLVDGVSLPSNSTRQPCNFTTFPRTELGVPLNSSNFHDLLEANAVLKYLSNAGVESTCENSHSVIESIIGDSSNDSSSNGQVPILPSKSQEFSFPNTLPDVVYNVNKKQKTTSLPQNQLARDIGSKVYIIQKYQEPIPLMKNSVQSHTHTAKSRKSLKKQVQKNRIRQHQSSEVRKNEHSTYNENMENVKTMYRALPTSITEFMNIPSLSDLNTNILGKFSNPDLTFEVPSFHDNTVGFSADTMMRQIGSQRFPGHKSQKEIEINQDGNENTDQLDMYVNNNETKSEAQDIDQLNSTMNLDDDLDFWDLLEIPADATDCSSIQNPDVLQSDHLVPTMKDNQSTSTNSNIGSKVNDTTSFKELINVTNLHTNQSIEKELSLQVENTTQVVDMQTTNEKSCQNPCYDTEEHDIVSLARTMRSNLHIIECAEKNERNVPGSTSVGKQPLNRENTEPAQEGSVIPNIMSIAIKLVGSLWKNPASSDKHHIILAIQSLLLVTDENSNTILHLAILNRQEWVLRQLLSVLSTMPSESLQIINAVNSNYLTALHMAVLTSQHGAVDLLLQHQADINLIDFYDNTIFHLAVAVGHSKSLKLLTLHTSAFSTYRDVLHAYNIDGLTALHVAVLSGSDRCMRHLVAINVSVDLPDRKSGRSPLHYAVEIGNVGIAEYLLKEGKADVNSITFDGIAPLHLACESSNAAMVTLLMTMGADPTIESDEKLNALDSLSDTDESGGCNGDFCDNHHHGLSPMDIALDKPEIYAILTACWNEGFCVSETELLASNDNTCSFHTDDFKTDCMSGDLGN